MSYICGKITDRHYRVGDCHDIDDWCSSVLLVKCSQDPERVQENRSCLFRILIGKDECKIENDYHRS